MNYTRMAQMAQRHQKVSESRFSRPGFGLMQLVVAMAVIGILATFSFSYLQQQNPEYQRNQFITQLNALLVLAAQNALVINKVHKVSFDFVRHRVSILVDQEKKDKKGDRLFTPMESAYANSTLEYSPYLETRNFFIGKEDEFGTGKKEEAWFFIIPEGLAQEVTINMRDTNDTELHSAGEPIGLVLNPFTVQFTAHETFVKP